MLTEEEKDLMRRCLDAVRQGMPGFASRQPQLRMMATAAHALATIGDAAAREEGAHLAVIEAGTGTGKTLGYLLPALVLAHLRGKHLVVASSTVALQEQLLHKDVPALRQCLPFDVHCVVAKGRARYVCPVRLEMREQACADLPDDPDASVQDKAQSGRPIGVRLLGRLADAFAKGTWSGDRELAQRDPRRGLAGGEHRPAGLHRRQVPPIQALPVLSRTPGDEGRRPDRRQPRPAAGGC